MTDKKLFSQELSGLLQVSNVRDIDPDANLFDAGFLDSFGAVALAELLRKHLPEAQPVDIEDLATIDTLRKVWLLVDQKPENTL